MYVFPLEMKFIICFINWNVKWLKYIFKTKKKPTSVKTPAKDADWDLWKENFKNFLEGYLNKIGLVFFFSVKEARINFRLIVFDNDKIVFATAEMHFCNLIENWETFVCGFITFYGDATPKYHHHHHHAEVLKWKCYLGNLFSIVLDLAYAIQL